MGQAEFEKTNEENKKTSSRAVSANQFDLVSTIQYSIGRNFVITCILLTWMDVPFYYVLGSFSMIFKTLDTLTLCRLNRTWTEQSLVALVPMIQDERSKHLLLLSIDNLKKQNGNSKAKGLICVHVFYTSATQCMGNLKSDQWFANECIGPKA